MIVNRFHVCVTSKISREHNTRALRLTQSCSQYWAMEL